MQRACVLIMMTALTSLLQAQPAASVLTRGPLDLSARLRTFAVDVTVPLSQPAALLVLQYDAERGWTPVRRLAEDGPTWHEGTSASVLLPRRTGQTQVPAGTAGERPVDPGLGCSAQGGVYSIQSGDCSVGGSSMFHVLLDQPRTLRDYRAAVLRMLRKSRNEIQAALSAIPRSGPGRELEHVVTALGIDPHTGWAVLVVPVSADHLPGIRP